MVIPPSELVPRPGNPLRADHGFGMRVVGAPRRRCGFPHWAGRLR